MARQRKKAIYSRKSRWTGKGESIENQVIMCKEYLQRTEFGIDFDTDVLVYEDEGYSGGNLIRPQFTRMMEDARAGRIDTIVCYRLDRVSRNIGDFAKLIDELSGLKISFVSIKEQFDTGSPMGKAMMYIASVFSQLERETIAERIRDNMHELAKTGRWLGGNTPLGYTSEEIHTETLNGKSITSHKLKIQEEDAALVVIIFEQYLKLKSLTGTETFLIQNNYKTRLNHYFSPFALKGILSNPTYMLSDEEAYCYLKKNNVGLCSSHEEFDGVHGILVYNRTEQIPHRATKYKPTEEWIVTVGKHKGLISGKDWIAVQKLLLENSTKNYRYRAVRITPALLSGLLHCSCGNCMRPKISNRLNAAGERVYVYNCELKEKSRRTKCSSKPLDGNYLDRCLCDMLKSLSTKKSKFREHLKRNKRIFTEGQGRYESDLDRSRKSQESIKAEIQSLISKLASAPDEIGDLLMENIRTLSLREKELAKQIQEFEQMTEPQLAAASPFDAYESLLSSFSETLDTMTTAQKRMAVRSLVRDIIWDGTNIHIFLFGCDDDDRRIMDGDMKTSEQRDSIFDALARIRG